MKRYRVIFPFLFALLVALIFYALYQFMIHVDRETDQEIQKQKHPALPKVGLTVEFLSNIFSPVHSQIKWFSNSGDILDILDVPGGILAATSGGLILYTYDGAVHKAGRTTGLSFSSTFRLIRAENGIYAIGNYGFLLFKESIPKSVSGHLFRAPDLGQEKITDGVYEGGELYLLTEKSAIYHVGDRSMDRICLFKKEMPTRLSFFKNRFYVGTVRGGLFSLEKSAGGCEISQIADGTELGEVKTLYHTEDTLWIGAANGLFKYTDDTFQADVTGQMVTAVHSDSEGILYGNYSGGLYFQGEKRPVDTLPNPVNVIRNGNERLLIGTDSGVWSLEKSHSPDTPEILIPNSKISSLAENYTTALAFDKGNLFVGGLNTGLFGLDIHTGKLTPMIPDEPGISAISRYGDNKWVLGTTTGFLQIDSNAKINRKLNKKQGLIHSNVTAVLPHKSAIYAATAAGLSRITQSQVRSIYAFHGLINNHLYSLAPSKDGIWVGTLGGVCEVGGPNGLTVTRCLSEKEGLSHPWVTALEYREGRLFIGTYGGGIMILDEQDSLIQVPGSKKASINLNASVTVEQNVCFGTLQRGILCVNQENKLISINKGLPSTNVTALAADGSRLAAGTDCGVVVLPLHLLEDEYLL